MFWQLLIDEKLMGIKKGGYDIQTIVLYTPRWTACPAFCAKRGARNDCQITEASSKNMHSCPIC